MLIFSVCEWGTKGWIFQERLLAKKLIILTECRSALVTVQPNMTYFHGNVKKEFVEINSGYWSIYLPDMNNVL